MRDQRLGKGCWLRDFQITRKGVRSKSTQIIIPVTPLIVAESFDWLKFYFRFKHHEAKQNAFTRAFTVFSFPENVRPWYLIWPIMRRAGGRFVDRPEKADICLYYQDQTQCDIELPATAAVLPGINLSCQDVSKSAVTRANDEVFDVKLAVNPLEFHGKMVEKSEKNGAHDGRILQGPIAKSRIKSGKIYQRYIERAAEKNQLLRDYRTVIIGNAPALIFLKERSADYLFENRNDRVDFAVPQDYFSPEEMAQIKEFCRRMKLDCGGIDIIRERETGKICVVDVNKTDMGPPTALSPKKQIAAVDKLAESFASFIESMI